MAIKFDELLEALDPSLDKFEEDLNSMWIIIPTEKRYDNLTTSDYDEFIKKYGIFNSRQACWDKIDELAPDRWDAFVPLRIEGDSSLDESYDDLATIKIDFIIDDEEIDSIKDYLKSNFNIDLVDYDKNAIYDNGTLRGPKKELVRYLSTVYQGLDEDDPDIDWIKEYYPELLDESLNEALKDTRVKSYDTKFGTFIIKTREGKSRRTNYMTGKKEWMPVKSTLGYFEDFPLAVEFFLHRDGQNRYVSSSQGRRSDEWVEFLNVRDYDQALNITEKEVVRCFQDYYGDDSIY